MNDQRVEVVHAAAPPLGPGVRTRIAPAPSGDLHVGNVRTALYNWALARRHGGSFLLRVEDTDRTRATDEAYAALQEVLRWVGLDWDEGPGVGGPHAPYRQSERLESHLQAAERLRAAGKAYRCYCTPEELAERRALARAEHRTPGYDGRCRRLTDSERAAFEAAGRTHVLRFAMAPGSTTFTDLVRGQVSIRHEDIPDFTLTRSDGHPLYLLAAAVDDIAMRLTHIVRGEDLIAATPRQLAIYQALGYPQEQWPAFGHLPLIIADDGKPLSKRNGEVSLAWYRAAGFLPEALRNYLALLGWSLPGGEEIFSLDDMVAAFSLERVSRNPARFDVRKLEAQNGEWIRRLSVPELTERLVPLLAEAGLPLDRDVLGRAVPLAQERMTRLTQAPGLLGYLLVGADRFAALQTDRLEPDALAVLEAAEGALREVDEWSVPAIEAALRSTLLADGLGLKPKHAFGPVRVAVTGRRVSLPLWESLELLGREETLRRLRTAIEGIAAAT